MNSEAFIVLDNTGWAQMAVPNSMPKKIYHDVTYKMEIKTTFAANDLY